MHKSSVELLFHFLTDSIQEEISADVLCAASTENDALSARTLERLSALGVDVSQPRRDRSLPVPTL